MNKPILTIGIPTYNRPKKLKQCLISIGKQKLTKDIEVLISIDGSTDDTEAIVKKFISSSKLNLRYIKNKKNLGFDHNIISIYKNSRGKYVWFLGDDDQMLTGAIKNMIKILKEESPTVIHPNSMNDKGNILLKNGSFIDIVNYMPTGIRIRINISKKFIITNEIERMAISRSLSFISYCIVKRDKTLIKNLYQFVGSGIMQDAIVSFCLKKNPCAYISKTPSISGGAKEYFSEWFITSTLYGVRQLYSNKLLDYPKNLWQKLALNNCKFVLTILAQEKILSIPIYYRLTFKEIKKIIKVYQWEIFSLFPFIIFIYISKFIPKAILSNIFRFGYFLAKKMLKR